MKNLYTLFFLIICSSLSAQSNHTITIGDATNDFTSSENLGASGGRTGYLTWDGTSLFIGITDNPLVGTNSNLYVVIDTDPATAADSRSGAGRSDQPTGESGGASYPFNADYVYQFFGTGSNDGSIQNPAPGNRWVVSGGSWSSASIPSGVRIRRHSTDITDLEIPFSNFGSPTTFNVLFYVANTDGGGSNFALWPTNNSGGNNPTLTHYFTYDNTSGVTPNAQSNLSIRLTSGGFSFGESSLANLTVLTTGTYGCGSLTSITKNLYIGSGATFSMGSNTAALSVTGNLTFSGTLMLSTNSGGDINVGKDFTIESGGTFTHNSRQISLTGFLDQTITGPLTFAYLDFTKATGNVDFMNVITVVNRLKNSSSGLSVSSNTNLNFNTAGALLENTGSGTVDFSGVNVVFASGATSTISGSAGFTFNNLSLYANSTLSNTATVTVNSTLILTNCLFTLGSNTLTIGASGSISPDLSSFSASNMIVADGTGFLRKTYTANGSFTFPIGDNTSTAEYSPATVNITSAVSYSSAYVQANLDDIKHPNNGSTENYITRYWTVEASGISTPIYSIDLTYVDDDIVTDEALMILGKYSGSTWSVAGTTNALTNTLTGTALTSFSDFTGGSTAFLPVELIDFQVAAKTAAVELTWTTATEQNCSHFEIQRSVDARTWQTLGKVEGAGFSTTLRNYEFFDEKPLPLNFYRLRQVDFDESASFSKVISVQFEGSNQPPRLSPNPVENELTLDFDQEIEPGQSALIFDQTGKLVLETALQPGEKCQFDVSQLSPGVYFLKIKGKEWQERFVKN